MKQHLLSITIALLSIATGAWAGDLKIGGKVLTVGQTYTRSSGLASLTAGTITFTDAEHVTFSNVTLVSAGNIVAISTSINGLTITLVGENKAIDAGFKTGIYINEQTTIAGNGSLYIETSENAVEYTSGKSLTIDGATLRAKGAKYGFKGGGQYSKLTLKNKAILEAWGDEYSLYGVGLLNGGEVTRPTDASFLRSKLGVVDETSEIIKQEWVSIRADVIAINKKNFPDDNFRNWILSQSFGNTGVLGNGANLAPTSFLVQEKDIANLKGVEYFTNLKILWCHKNQLEDLDVSKLTLLEDFTCSNNKLTTLDVSQNTALKELRCSENQLQTLDVSKNAVLQHLYCDGNQLTSLDLSKNTALKILDCHGNSIRDESMDALIQSLPDWKGATYPLYVYKDESATGNMMTSLQVAAAKEKGWIPKKWDGSAWVDYEGIVVGIPIDETNFPDANFRTYVSSNEVDKDENGYLTDEEIAAVTYMDLSSKEIGDLTGIKYFTALEELYCSHNPLTTLDVSGCTALKELWCYQNQLTTLNASGCTALKELWCYQNQLTTLDVSGCTALESLGCYYNQLTTLNMSGCTALVNLICNNNRLTTLNVSGFTALKELQIYYNQLTTLNVSGCTALKGLQGYNNQLATLDVSGCTALGYLTCWNNQLTTLNISGCIALKTLQCPSNKLTTLDVSGCTILENLICNDNQLTTLNVSGCTALVKFYCWNNQLATLNVSGCTALKELICFENQLTMLNVSGCTALVSLDCYNNQLTTLNASECTSLVSLHCYDNPLTALDVSGCTALSYLLCYNNHLHGEGMNDFVNSLPEVTTGELRVYVIDSPYNKMTPEQVAAAKAKNWKVLMLNGSDWVDFEGIIDGDANGDKKVNVADIVAIVNHINQVIVPGFAPSAADVNCDGSVDEDDIELIKKMIMGK